MKRHVEYLAVKGSDTKKVKVEVYYSKGGINYATYKTEPRGYYASATPVEKNGIMESYVMFSGFKQFISEVKRYSDKGFDAAVAAAKSSGIRERLIEAVCKKEGLVLEGIKAE